MAEMVEVFKVKCIFGSRALRPSMMFPSSSHLCCQTLYTFSVYRHQQSGLDRHSHK